MTKPPAQATEDEPERSASDADALDAPDVALAPAELRGLGEPEVEDLKALLHQFGDDVQARLQQRFTFKVLVRADIEPHRRVVALDQERLADLAPYDPIFIGIPVAHLSRKGARLTLEGGRLVAPHATRRTVTVDEKGAQLFLYGRHLFVRSIQRVTGHPKVGETVLVTQTDGRYLGMGLAQEPLLAMKGKRGGKRGPQRDPTEIAVHHQLDLGLYLRAQQDVPE